MCFSQGGAYFSWVLVPAARQALRVGDGLLRTSASSSAQSISTESKSTSRDLWGAADAICSNAPRPEIEVFVRDALEGCSPSEAHRSITNVSWASIYTTNYDTLVEQAYHEKLSTRRQEPRPVYQFSTDYNIHNNANVHILKLHGSIDQIHHKENVLVLTTKDVTDTHTVRMTMLSNIPRLLLDYYWLFIGYSFTDGVLRQLLAEVRKSNRDSMPRASFALLPKVTDEDRDFFRPIQDSDHPRHDGTFYGGNSGAHRSRGERQATNQAHT